VEVQNEGKPRKKKEVEMSVTGKVAKYCAIGLVCLLIAVAGAVLAYGPLAGAEADIGEGLTPFDDRGEVTVISIDQPIDERRGVIVVGQSPIGGCPDHPLKAIPPLEVWLMDEDGSLVAVDDSKGVEMIDINYEELGIRSLAEFEAHFPPNPDGEFIIHDIPPFPVVIDGVRYEPEDIHLFNGQVLRFVEEEGVIYAFTTPEGLEQFVEERWGEELFAPEGPTPTHGDWTVLYEHWQLGGRFLMIEGWLDVWHLGFFDNITSSATTGIREVTLFDGPGFTGNSFWLNDGTTYSFFWFFNDRATSVQTH
jgi:hypothetical protein